MRNKTFPFFKPDNVTIEHNGFSEKAFFLGHGAYNAAYKTQSGYVVSIPFVELDPEKWKTIHSPKLLVEQTDSFERKICLWNTFNYPRLLAHGTLLKRDLSEAVFQPATSCDVTYVDKNNTPIKTKCAYVPFINGTTDFSIEKILENISLTYRGDPTLNIPGGRILADILVRGNALLWEGIIIFIDTGALFSMTTEDTLARKRSEVSLDAWFQQPKSTTNFQRETIFRAWYAKALFMKETISFSVTKNNEVLTSTKDVFIKHDNHNPRFNPNYTHKRCTLFLSAICYLACHRPQYLDLSLLLEPKNEVLLQSCAFLFLRNDPTLQHDIGPDVFGPEKTLKKILNNYFPDLSGYSFVKEADQLSYPEVIKRYYDERYKNLLKEIHSTKKLDVAFSYGQITNPNCLVLLRIALPQNVSDLRNFDLENWLKENNIEDAAQDAKMLEILSELKSLKKLLNEVHSDLFMKEQRDNVNLFRKTWGEYLRENLYTIANMVTPLNLLRYCNQRLFSSAAMLAKQADSQVNRSMHHVVIQIPHDP